MIKIRNLERLASISTCPVSSSSSSSSSLVALSRFCVGPTNPFQGWAIVIFDQQASTATTATMTAAKPFVASPPPFLPRLDRRAESSSTSASTQHSSSPSHPLPAHPHLHSSSPHFPARMMEGSTLLSAAALPSFSIHRHRLSHFDHFRDTCPFTTAENHRLQSLGPQLDRPCHVLNRHSNSFRPAFGSSKDRLHRRSFTTSSSMASSALKQVEIQDFVATLDEEGRMLLAQELKAATEAEAAAADEVNTPPTFAQLRAVCVHSMLPFIGFGFLDNALMIIAGDYIDTTIGVTLGITTMAAAGFGNLFSDLAGLGCAHYIESFALLLGFRAPKMSFKQKELAITRFSGNFGRAVGVTIGCLLGMFPLLFLGGRDDDECQGEREKAKTVTVESEAVAVVSSQAGSPVVEVSNLTATTAESASVEGGSVSAEAVTEAEAARETIMGESTLVKETEAATIVPVAEVTTTESMIEPVNASEEIKT